MIDTHQLKPSFFELMSKNRPDKTLPLNYRAGYSGRPGVKAEHYLAHPGALLKTAKNTHLTSTNSAIASAALYLNFIADKISRSHPWGRPTSMQFSAFITKFA